MFSNLKLTLENIMDHWNDLVWSILKKVQKNLSNARFGGVKKKFPDKIENKCHRRRRKIFVNILVENDQKIYRNAAEGGEKSFVILIENNEKIKNMPPKPAKKIRSRGCNLP